MDTGHDSSNDGETGRLLRSTDWSRYPVGPIESWPQSLKTAVDLVLNSRFPMFLTWGPRRTFIYNDAYRPILGRKHPDAFANDFEAVWTEIWPDLRQLIREADRGRATYLENLKLTVNRHGHDEEAYFTFSYSPVRSEAGAIEGLHCACVETTPTVLAERDLVDTLESMSDAFISVDRDWRITRVNGAYERTSRLGRARQIGRNLIDLWFADPAYEQSIYLRSYRRAMSERVAVHFEDYYQPLGVWTEVRVYPKGDGGLAIFFTDITKRKHHEDELAAERQKLRESELRLKLTLQEIPYPIVIHAEDGEILFTNDSWAEITGYDPAEVRTIADWTRLAYGDNAEAVRTNIDRLYSAENTTVDGEYEVRIKNGGVRVWEFSSTPIGVGADGRRCVISTARDVTESKQAEATRRLIELDLIVAKEEAERSNQLKSAFLANMSHEIRTPLGVMIGFADLITDPAIDQAQRTQFAATLKRNGEQLSVLINDILDLSKVEAGYLTIELVEVSLRALIDDVLGALEVKAVEKGLRLEARVPGHIPDAIVSDPTRVRQVLWNLIGNAIKFTERGHVTLSVARVDQTYRFEVTDSGIGIRAADQDKLFKTFSQADASMTRRFGGTGLGLALSRRLAELLGGDLTLRESRPRAGSTFLFTIKDFRRPDQVAPKICPVLVAPNRELGRRPLERIRVLLTEDSPDNQQLISSLLTQRGATVDIANNGAEGVERALREDYDVVLMDIQMPVLDGYTATQRLRDQGFRKPIIALTAHAMNDVREKCMDVGCSHHLPKPINPRDLIEAILSYVIL